MQNTRNIIKSEILIPLNQVDNELLFNVGVDNFQELINVFPGITGIKIIEYKKYYKTQTNFEMLRRWIDSFGDEYIGLKYVPFVKKYREKYGNVLLRVPKSFDGLNHDIIVEINNHIDYKPVFTEEQEQIELSME